MTVSAVDTIGEYDYFYCKDNIPKDFSCKQVIVSGKIIMNPEYDIMTSISGQRAVMFRFPRGEVPKVKSITVVT